MLLNRVIAGLLLLSVANASAVIMDGLCSQSRPQLKVSETQVSTGRISNDYAARKAKFKMDLYNRQIGLMNPETYLEFIEPYLQRAEQDLQVSKYLMSQPDSVISRTYFASLLYYNVAIFHNYVKPSAMTAGYCKQTGDDVHTVIEQIKATGQLADLDIDQEFKATEKLFKDANRAYYKALRLSAKFKLLMISYLV